MFPKIIFLTSYYLQSKIISCPYDRNKLIKFKDEVEKKFNHNKNTIIKKIEKLTGVAWVEEEINVWIFKGWHTSISNPLMLNYYNYDVEFCFFNLIHELVHNNLIELNIKKNDGEINLIELEAVVNLITISVLKEIYSEKALKELCEFAEFGGLYKYVWERVYELKQEINLSKTTIKKWCSNKKNYYL